MPDAYRGEAAKAFVEAEGAAPRLTLEALRGFPRRQARAARNAAALEIRASLPRSPSASSPKRELDRGGTANAATPRAKAWRHPAWTCASRPRRSRSATKLRAFMRDDLAGGDPREDDRRPPPLQGRHRHLAAHPERARLGGAALAGGMGRHGLDRRSSVYLYQDEMQRRRRRAARLQRQHGRAGDRRVRQRGAEAALPAAHRQSRRLVVPGLLRAGRRLRPRVAARPRAERDGDHYIVNGQKIWTTLAQYADWIFCLVRTDPAAKKQEGISFLLIDMKTPGITVRPIHTIDGGHEVNEVFFDDVRVPVENLVGEENKGWDYAKFLLGNERTGIARVGVSKARIAPHQGTGGAASPRGDRPLIDDPRFREKLAAVEVELKALEMTQMRVVSASATRESGKPDPASSILKIKGSEIQQATTRTADGGRRALRPAVPRRRRRSAERAADRPGLGGRRWRRSISTTARSRSTAARTKSSSNIIAKAILGLVSPLQTLSMDFDLTEEQRLLQGQRRPADRRPLRFRAAQDAMHGEPDGFSRGLWAQYAETGPARRCRSPKQTAASAAAPVETMIVMEAFGRGLALEPYLATVVLGGGLLRPAAATPTQRRTGADASRPAS